VGKGPSYARGLSIGKPLGLLTLNHACKLALEPAVRQHRFLGPVLAHFTDLSAYLDCRAVVDRHDALAVCLPWYPHVQFQPAKTPLAELCDHCPPLESLRQAGRLFSYNSTRAHLRPPGPGLQRIAVRHFSAVPAVNILAAAGVRRIETLGIDGGTQYAEGFDERDRLSNGRSSFDAQFAEIRATCARDGITFTTHAPETQRTVTS
jgi:hypothetical protein